MDSLQSWFLVPAILYFVGVALAPVHRQGLLSRGEMSKSDRALFSD
jgi:hypothetical protein